MIIKLYSRSLPSHLDGRRRCHCGECGPSDNNSCGAPTPRHPRHLHKFNHHYGCKSGKVHCHRIHFPFFVCSITTHPAIFPKTPNRCLYNTSYTLLTKIKQFDWWNIAWYELFAMYILYFICLLTPLWSLHTVSLPILELLFMFIVLNI